MQCACSTPISACHGNCTSKSFRLCAPANWLSPKCHLCRIEKLCFQISVPVGILSFSRMVLHRRVSHDQMSMLCRTTVRIAQWSSINKVQLGVSCFCQVRQPLCCYSLDRLVSFSIQCLQQHVQVFCSVLLKTQFRSRLLGPTVSLKRKLDKWHFHVLCSLASRWLLQLTVLNGVVDTWWQVTCSISQRHNLDVEVVRLSLVLQADWYYHTIAKSICSTEVENESNSNSQFSSWQKTQWLSKDSFPLDVKHTRTSTKFEYHSAQCIQIQLLMQRKKTWSHASSLPFLLDEMIERNWNSP